MDTFILQEPPVNDMTTPPLPTLSTDELLGMDAYWRACNYLAAGMIYLRDNPLLKEPLQPEHVKSRLLGHWGRVPVWLSPMSISTA